MIYFDISATAPFQSGPIIIIKSFFSYFRLSTIEMQTNIFHFPAQKPPESSQSDEWAENKSLIRDENFMKRILAFCGACDGGKVGGRWIRGKRINWKGERGEKF